MKMLFTLVLLVGFLMVGCQNENSILEPTNNNVESLNKGRITNTDNLDFKYDNTNNTFSVMTKTFTVNGKKGDDLFISETTLLNGKLVSMTAKLTIPQNAFKGKLTFDVIFDFENFSVELYPSPFTFDKPILLNLTFTGVDFSNIDTQNLTFNYLDGESEVIKYKSLRVDEKLGLLRVEEAELHHFSRYGWTRTNR